MGIGFLPYQLTIKISVFAVVGLRTKSSFNFLAADQQPHWRKLRYFLFTPLLVSIVQSQPVIKLLTNKPKEENYSNFVCWCDEQHLVVTLVEHQKA